MNDAACSGRKHWSPLYETMFELARQLIKSTLDSLYLKYNFERQADKCMSLEVKMLQGDQATEVL
jgi:hypothetical protein